jgi:hypothetical protein
MTEIYYAEPLHLQQANPYAHPRNKTAGRARLCFGSLRWGDRPHAWILPGGAFTSNEMDAQHYVEQMDRLMKANAAFEGTGFIGRSERPALAA